MSAARIGPVEDGRIDGAPPDGRSTDDKPIDSTPADCTLSDDRPTDGKPAQGRSICSGPAESVPAAGGSFRGGPVDGGSRVRAGGSRRVTVYDIARETGLSASTVSRALNNSALSSEATRGKILDAARTLGYRKRVIRRHGNRAIVTIRLFLPYAEDASIHLFYDIASLLAGLREGFGGTRLSVIAELADGKTDVFDNKKLGDLDGVVSAFTVPDERTVREVRSRGIPLVLLNRIDERLEYIAYDSADGMERLLEAVSMKRPEVRSCYIGFDPVRPVSEARFEGLKEGCARRGIRFGDEDAFRLGSLAEIDARLLETILGRGYNAVFCFNDLAAVNLYRTASAAGIPIPERFSLTGFDRSPVRDLAARKVDTIHLSIRKLGIEAGRLLKERIIDRAAGPVRKLLQGEYVPGETV